MIHPKFGFVVSGGEISNDLATNTSEFSLDGGKTFTYDPSVIPDMPTKNKAHCLVLDNDVTSERSEKTACTLLNHSIQDQLVTIGGSDGKVYLASVYRLLNSGTWETSKPLPKPLAVPACGVLRQEDFNKKPT